MDIAPRRIFVPWLGDAELSANRRRSLACFDDLSIPVVRITSETVDEWILPEDPLPEAWRHLTPIHQNDVLRCYLMHHHGGGYSDIKAPGGEWVSSFDRLNATSAWAVGYPEYWWGVATLGSSRFGLGSTYWWRARYLQARYRSLIGNCAFIFKPGTPLTREWLDLTMAKLEALGPSLERRPARGPRERAGEVVDGVMCDYPVSWTALGGDIFHPLVLRHRARITASLPRPKIDDYL